MAYYNSVFFDCNGFVHNNTFIFKELAVISCDNEIFAHFLFEPPFSFCELSKKDQIINTFLAKDYHMIQWYEGFTPYSKLTTIFERLSRTYSNIWVLGEELIEHVRPYIPSPCTVKNLQELGCPPLVDLLSMSAPTCLLSHPACSESTVFRMKQWTIENPNKFIEFEDFSRQSSNLFLNKMDAYLEHANVSS